MASGIRRRRVRPGRRDREASTGTGSHAGIQCLIERNERKSPSLYGTNKVWPLKTGFLPQAVSWLCQAQVVTAGPAWAARGTRSKLHS